MAILTLEIQTQSEGSDILQPPPTKHKYVKSFWLYKMRNLTRKKIQMKGVKISPEETDQVSVKMIKSLFSLIESPVKNKKLTFFSWKISKFLPQNLHLNHFRLIYPAWPDSIAAGWSIHPYQSAEYISFVCSRLEVEMSQDR